MDGGKRTATYMLNNNGLATSCIVKDKNGNIDKEYTFDYSEGYLTRMSYSDSYGTETITFIYSNGNITKINYKTKYDNESYTFTYSSQTNKGRIVCPILLDVFFDSLPAYYAGILGKATANLPSSCIVKDNFETLSYPQLPRGS
ncbi:DUF4595 domain-containing protein [Bacteroidales bacterium OttesenSCG-928-M06]|nr:DUF4595 domain-containing protein [Bacteroidales bacterium OttesenSCG-928-M06]